MRSVQQGKRALRGARPALLALVFSLAGATPAWGQNGDLFNYFPVSDFFGGANLSICARTANVVASSCLRDVQTDFFLETAKANNLSDSEARGQAVLRARSLTGSARAECGAQWQARLELCEELEENRYDPVVDPDDFQHPIAEPNPYFPLVPGTTWIYEAETEDGLERIEVTVTEDTVEILGAVCTVVLDQVFVDGELVEDTRDYYAQDVEGNVWYFGENSLEVEDGLVVALTGSWTAGVDGAKPGIIMKANPEVGEVYRQEFALTEAEDAAAVLSLSDVVEVTFGQFADCLRTAEFTPISPDALENKFYAPGVGPVLEISLETGERVELIEFIAPEP